MVLSFLLLSCATAALAGNHSYISRDVVVIGGGSSGTHAAFRLRQEGLSVALLERGNRLGGHVNTFRVPNTNTSFDFGVIFYHNISVASNYFSALGVDIIAAPSGGTSVSTYADINGDAKATTLVPPSMPWANSTAVTTATEKYVNLYNTQFSFLDDGFNFPDPVPEDILLPWADFMAKYGLDPISFSAYKYFSSLTAGGFLGIGPALITTADFNNQGIYDKALEKLGEGEGAFLNVTINHITRDEGGVSVTMKTPYGGEQTVRAKQLIIAIPPVVADLRAVGLDLSAEEEHLFGQASFRWYFDAVIRNSGLPDDIALSNIDFTKPDGIPIAPQIVLAVGQVGLTTGVPGLQSLYYSSDRNISNTDAQADILATLARYRAANGLDTSVKTEFVGFHNHEPFELTVPVDVIRKGYYKERNKLQGCRNT
ncbi:hypothetical protein MVEN_01678800 [Mycena venus]|uniref:Amine oxidase n=1 Tax=Mycena venus TaxID=2733690 RepID=A0A8H7CPW2_9AGAR|nr:hypothetical protein MVEN_01678800 [Mycena venus]